MFIHVLGHKYKHQVSQAPQALAPPAQGNPPGRYEGFVLRICRFVRLVSFFLGFGVRSCFV